MGYKLNPHSRFVAIAGRRERYVTLQPETAVQWGQMNISEPVREVQERSDRQLVDFLNTDLEIGFTFCQTARVEHGFDPDGLEQAKENVRKVIRCVDKFVLRVRDEAQRVKIQARLAELEGLFLTHIQPLSTDVDSSTLTIERRTNEALSRRFVHYRDPRRP